MKVTEDDFPPTLVTAVRSGFDAFVQLQRLRFGKFPSAIASAPPASDASRGVLVTTTTTNATAVADTRPASLFPETLCEWSDILLSRMKAISSVTMVLDPTAEVVWELVSVVIAILENGGDDGVNASAPYLEWYRGRFVNVDAIYKVRDTLKSAVSLDSFTSAEETDFFEGLMGPYMISIERAFLSGLFPVTAELINSLIVYLRSCAADVFDAEEESCLTDVVRLLLEAPGNSAEHLEWVNTANTLVLDSKRILAPTHAASNMIMHAAQQLKSLCFDLLLMISGDAMLILETCHSLELDVMEYTAAVCAICKPYMTLRKVYQIYQSALESWGRRDKGPWYVDVIESLLGSRSLADVVKAMTLVRDAVVRNECFSTVQKGGAGAGGGDGIVFTPRRTGCGREGRYGVFDLESEPGLPADTNIFRRFALLFMAAHVADICAPPFGAAVDHMDVTFARNSVIEDFVSLFQHHPLLWRTAAMYMVYSPFANPVSLYNIVTGCAANVVNDRYMLLSLQVFIQSSWEENSAFQVSLRRVLHDKYPLSDTLNRWIASVDHYRRKAVEALHDILIRERWECGDTALAMWLAVESQQSESLQIRFERMLRSPEALELEEVYRVGQAVNNSFILVDTSANLRVLHVLQTCAALAEYRRAHSVLCECNVTKSAVAPDSVDATHHVLRAADKALRNAVSFRMHPLSVLALVEQTADVALCHAHKQRPSGLVPLLCHALEMVLAYHLASQSDYAARAAAIREKIMRLA